MRFGLLVCRQYACFGDDVAVGMSYTGSTPALGAGRPGSIPGIPTVVLSDSPGNCRRSEGNGDRVPATLCGAMWAEISDISTGVTYNLQRTIHTTNNLQHK